MMIRINLLPVRQVQKREAGRQYIVLVVAMLLLALGANGYWYSWMEGKREAAQRRLDETNNRIAQLEKVIGEVTNINKRKKEVEEKLAVLDKLRKQRAGPVKLLDALSTAMPKKVWVTDFEERQGGAVLSGGAESFEDVSELMRSMNTIVWTPKGMGRVVERKRDGSSARVEILQGDAAIVDFASNEISYFFSNLELKSTEAVAGRNAKAVRFELALNVNYAI
jgi:type IV pilus assembly protein PilN